MANRIQILQWRQCGDDEDSLSIGVHPHDVEADLIDDARAQVDPDAKPEDWEGAEDRLDYGHLIYVNADVLIGDGEIMAHNGRKFRINITEVTDTQETTR